MRRKWKKYLTLAVAAGMLIGQMRTFPVWAAETVDVGEENEIVEEIKQEQPEVMAETSATVSGNGENMLGEYKLVLQAESDISVEKYGSYEEIVGSTACSQSDAVSWAINQIGKSLDYDGVYGAQCVDLIAYYYQALGTTTPGGNAIDYASNKLPSGWTRVYGNYQPGDIVVWYANHTCGSCITGAYGHIGIVTSVDSSTINVVDQNGPSNKGYCKANSYPLSAIKCAIRPDFSNNGSGDVFSDVYVENITETNAVIKGTLSGTTYVTNVGLYIGKDNSEMYKVVESANMNVKYLTYDVNKWVGKLQPGTTYKYQLYVTINGTEYLSECKTFTTLGTEVTSSFSLADHGIYRIRNVNSGKLLTADWNDSRIYQWSDNGASQQLWRAEQTEDGYIFVSVATGKVMDMNGANIDEGTDLCQYGYHGGANQRFKIVDRGNGRSSLHPVSSNLALDVYGYSLEDGGKISQYAYHGNNNQLWTFEVADNNAPSISNVTVTDISGDGYTVVCSVNDNFGVSRVCFPTWTEYNGQDDLTGDWYNQTAVFFPNENNQYIYRVNIADHNYEAGNYSTHIYAYDASGNYSCNTDVYVGVYPLTSIFLSRTSVTLTAGKQTSLSVTYNPDNTTASRDVTWTSSDTKVATVDGSGRVTAVAQGTAAIMAKVSGKTAVCNVTVQAVSNPTPAPTPRPTVTPAPAPTTKPTQSPSQSTEKQVRNFASRMYTVALGRKAETAGLNYWTDLLMSHDTDGAGIAHGFIMSQEFQNRNLNNKDYVNVLYKTFFNRSADADGQTYWLSALANGRPRSYVLAGFVNSNEFDRLCDSYGIIRGTMREDGTACNTGIRQFVERQYTKVLNRAGEKEGINYWTEEIIYGRHTPEEVGKLFFQSDEFLARKLSDAAYVETLYQTFLGRASDVDGKNYWINKLRSGMDRNTVLEGFSRSPEFADILADYGL